MVAMYSNGQSFIVKNDGKYFLVGVVEDEIGTPVLAEPPTSPDMFLRFGYFEEVTNKEVGKNIIEKIKSKIEKM